MEEMTKFLRALVLLELTRRAGDDVSGKPESVLARSGFKAKEIAELLGKSEAAVAKSISRANQAAKKQEVSPNE